MLKSSNDSDQYLEEARGGWDGSQGDTQDYSHPSWDVSRTAQGNWGAAPSYSEPSWDTDSAQVGQGARVGGGEAQVGSNRLEGRCGPPGF